MRVGKFRVAVMLARTFDSTLKQIMGKCIIVRAEHLFSCDCIEYVALSEHFRDLPTGEITPEYEWICSDTDGIRAEEVK